MPTLLLNLLISLLVGIAASVVTKVIVRLRMPVALATGAVLFALAVAITFLSNPPKAIPAVPDVGGYPEAQAVAVLSGAGFQVATQYQYNGEVPQYKVIKQNPIPGIQYNKGRTVTIWVSQGESTGVIIPDDIGQQVQALEAVNIILSRVPGRDPQIRIWLRDDPAYATLARNCLRILAGRKLRSPVPLDVIAGRVREGLGYKASDYIPPENYNDLERLKQAMLKAWNEQQAAGAQRGSFEDIVVDVSALRTPTATITEPVNGDVVGFRNLVRGRWTSIPDSLDIWVVVYPRAFPRYHPQTEPAQRSSDGAWSATAYVGAGPETDIGGKFDVHAVLADNQASREFREYLSAAAKAGDWPGLRELPRGARIVHTITVTRKAG
jgi:hypothetical protein